MFSHNPRWIICGEAQNGKEAIGKVLELKPDLVILDISMPELNGIDAAREIRKIAPTVKIVILTMHQSSQLESAARHAGSDEILHKGKATESLIRTVDRLFATDDSHEDSVDENLELTE
jgi:DNA-binding NarL/FixJ family response regulator